MINCDSRSFGLKEKPVTQRVKSNFPLRPARELLRTHTLLGRVADGPHNWRRQVKYRQFTKERGFFLSEVHFAHTHSSFGATGTSVMGIEPVTDLKGIRCPRCF